MSRSRIVQETWVITDRGPERGRFRYAVHPPGQWLAATMFADRDEAERFRAELSKPVRSWPADVLNDALTR